LEGIDCDTVSVAPMTGVCQLTHLLLRDTVGADDGRSTCHVHTALVVLDVVITHGGGDEAIEKAVGVFLLASQLVLAILVCDGCCLSGGGAWYGLAGVGDGGRKESFGDVCRGPRSCGAASHATQALEGSKSLGAGTLWLQLKSGNARVLVLQGHSLLIHGRFLASARRGQRLE